ncbi:MAG: flagellar biosynthetic protein FliQ [Pseudomonadota bacterium]|nr:flagellar biosynthetic protein FliQ [Pseudomonadota bacterium]
MSPELALTEISRGLMLALILGSPLLAVLIAGVVVGILQAATQINEQTIAFVAKAIALALTLLIAGGFLLGKLVSYTIDLFHRIPHLIG